MLFRSGWDLEVGLPKDDFLFTTVIGFDIALNDADDTGAREDQIWFQGDGTWNQPSSWGDAIMVDDMVKVETKGKQPLSFELGENYPNPFNPATHIPFVIDKMAHVELSVYNIIGHKVATLVNETKTPGAYEVKFKATDLPSGIYYYQLVSGSENIVKKMILMQ